MELSVGQVVYLRWRDMRRHAKDQELQKVTVDKVGRKWGTLSNGYRFDLRTLYLEGNGGIGYSSPGRIFLNPEVYEAAVDRMKAWGNLVKQTGRRCSPPDGVTAQDIEQATKLLGLVPLKDER